MKTGLWGPVFLFWERVAPLRLGGGSGAGGGYHAD